MPEAISCRQGPGRAFLLKEHMCCIYCGFTWSTLHFSVQGWQRPASKTIVAHCTPRLVPRHANPMQIDSLPSMCQALTPSSEPTCDHPAQKYKGVQHGELGEHLTQSTQSEASWDGHDLLGRFKKQGGLWASSMGRNPTRRAQNSGGSTKGKDLGVSEHRSNVCDLQELGAPLGT